MYFEEWQWAWQWLPRWLLWTTGIIFPMSIVLTVVPIILVPASAWFMCPLLAVLLILTNIVGMKTNVSGNGLEMQLSWWLPILWKRIPAEEILSQRLIAFDKWPCSNGWGFTGSVEGKACRCYGSYYPDTPGKGVIVETAQGPFLVGTRDPEGLSAALAVAREERLKRA